MAENDKTYLGEVAADAKADSTFSMMGAGFMDWWRELRVKKRRDGRGKERKLAKRTARKAKRVQEEKKGKQAAERWRRGRGRVSELEA